MLPWLAVAVLAPAVHAASAEATHGLSEEEIAAGFTSLFDGKTLDGWQGATGEDGYVVEEGKLVCPKTCRGNIFSEKQYKDFNFRFEFRLFPGGGNNGVAIRSPAVQTTSPAYVGMELQILDNHAPEWANLKPYQYHGSLYGCVPAKRGHMKPTGQWNSQEVIVRGRRIIVNLNGVQILDADLDKIPDPPMDGRQHPGLKREQGHVGFLGYARRVEFRNVRIKEL